MKIVQTSKDKMKIKTIKIASWSEFTAFAETSVKSLDSSGMIFRGQANAEWKLEPSLYRNLYNLEKLKNEFYKYDIEIAEKFVKNIEYFVEESALKNFILKAKVHKDFFGEFDRDNKLSWWAIMQHYGAPTRILDWTFSPFVALYFAVESMENEDGTVYSVFPGLLEIIQNMKHGVEDNGDNFKNNYEGGLEKFFREKVYKKTDDNILLISSNLISTQRMLAQQSVFMLSNKILISYDDLINEICSERKIHLNQVIEKYVIPKEMKKDFLVNLKAMNITANSLFPGFDGIGKATKGLVVDAASNQVKFYEKMLDSLKNSEKNEE